MFTSRFASDSKRTPIQNYTVFWPTLSLYVMDKVKCRVADLVGGMTPSGQ